jgi:hypothetical protein
MKNLFLLDILYRLLERAITALSPEHEVARGSAYPLTGNFNVFGPFVLRLEKFELKHLVKRHDFAVERGEFSGHVISRSEPLSLSLILPPGVISDISPHPLINLQAIPIFPTAGQKYWLCKALQITMMVTSRGVQSQSFFGDPSYIL